MFHNIILQNINNQRVSFFETLKSVLFCNVR